MRAILNALPYPAAHWPLHVLPLPHLMHMPVFITPLFSENKLTGTLPPELGAAWPAMEDMSLCSNAFTGPLPKEWSRMGRLKSLYL